MGLDQRGVAVLLQGVMQIRVCSLDEGLESEASFVARFSVLDRPLVTPEIFPIVHPDELSPEPHEASLYVQLHPQREASDLPANTRKHT